MRKHLPIRRAGDRARDAKNWSEATEAYERYLHLVPDEARIWIQLGHAHKEGGELEKAEAAYLTARGLLPKDADLQLQIGHLYKLQGRRSDAAESYAASLKLQATAEAYGELVRLGETVFANQVLDSSQQRLSPAIYFQVGDMLGYLIDHKTPSGIQRVQIGIIKAIAALGKAQAARYRFVHSSFGGDRLFLLDNEKLFAVASYVTQARVDHQVLRGLIQKVTSATMPLTLGHGDSFVILGSFWGHSNHSDALRSLKRQGAKVGVYFYDLIPITHPEFCDIETGETFSRALVEILNFVDFGLTISDHTKKELLHFLDVAGTKRIPVETVPLAHGIGRALGAPVHPDREWSDAIYELKDTRYVLFVSTVEIRKNHRYLFDIWKLLITEGVDVPTLLFVGRRGWRVDDLFGQLEATNFLDGKVKLLHDLSDAELSCLYRHCLFTAFPSFVEGWGLPIGESLSYGKLCVSSSEAAMPEVAGPLARYVDPLNTRAGLGVIRDLLVNPAEIAQWEAKITAGFRTRDWDDVARDFVRTVTTTVGALPVGNAPLFVPTLAAGDIFFAGRSKADLAKISHDIAGRVQRLILVSHWHLPEERGTRMSGTEGSLSMRTDVGANQPVRAILQVIASDTLRDGVLMVDAADLPQQRHPLSAGTEHVIHLDARTDDSGVLTIRLQVSRSDNGFGRGEIMLSTFGYTVADDPGAWAALLENAMRFNAQRASKQHSLRRVPA